MDKCWQKLGQAKRTMQQFLCDYYVLLWSNYQMLSIFAQLVITQSLNVTCWACPTYMYISQTHIYWGSHSVTTSHVSYCISPILCQSDTQLLRQAVSHYKSCKLLCQSNIMSVWYTATEAVCQSMHVSYWIIPALSVRHTATKLVSWSLHVSYWFSATLLVCQSDTQLWRQSVSQFM